jgi:serine/threonine protein kinase
MDCLDENQVAAFIGGELSGQERSRIHAHLDGCFPCSQLLARLIAARSRLELAATADAADVAGPRAVDAFDPVAGELLAGRYRVDRLLGRGGMGSVYRAFDVELREPVALKVLRPELRGDDRYLERFKREARLARKVAHPHVCRVFDLGFHTSRNGPLAFLTMELLAGETLAERIARRGPVDEAEACELARQIASALAAAHQCGVVHRDLKSANIILTGDPVRPRAVVTDFGLARSARGEVVLTGSLELLGSPAYMAPEQVVGGEITPLTDVYSLGVVLYEMVTGALPYLADTPVATAIARLNQPPVALRTLRPEISETFAALVERCMSRSPADRPPTAETVLDALAGRKIGAAPARRYRVAAGAALIVLAISGVIAIGANLQRLLPGETRRSPALPSVSSALPPRVVPAPASAVPPPVDPARPEAPRAPHPARKVSGTRRAAGDPARPGARATVPQLRRPDGEGLD